MLFYFCCPCLNVRVSCRSVGNNLPPFATEMAVARQHFEANRTVPSAIAKLSVGGLTVEHEQLVRRTKLMQARHWTIQTCLLCNTKVCCTTSSGGSAIVNAQLSLTEVDLKKKLTDPRYCAAFRVLVVRRSSKSPSNAPTNDQMDPKLSASLNTMVDTFVGQKELEAKRRVEVYYNEEQAKIRNMHRRLKRQMSSLTEQMVKVMHAEQQHQATLKQEEGSPALSVSSSNSPGSPNNYPPPASPLHKMPHIIYVPDSPKMSNNSEQATKDRFTAPLLTELDTQGDAIESPPVGPAEEYNEEKSSKDNDKVNDVGNGGNGKSSPSPNQHKTGSGQTEGKEEAHGTPPLAPTSGERRRRKIMSGGSGLGSGGGGEGSSNSEMFTLTPPAMAGSFGASGSRNLRDEEAKGRLRGIRMNRQKKTDSETLKQNMLMSTTAPARSDMGFAHFVSSGVEDLFDMDEDLDMDDVGGLDNTGDRLNGVVEEGGEEEEGEEEEEEENEAVGELPGNGARREINWNASYASSGLTMSQSYHAPAARDWWGEGVDDSDSEEEEEAQDGVGEKIVEPGSLKIFGSERQEVKVGSGGGGDGGGGGARNAQFYGSSMPMAIPSMGGRGKR